MNPSNLQYYEPVKEILHKTQAKYAKLNRATNQKEVSQEQRAVYTDLLQLTTIGNILVSVEQLAKQKSIGLPRIPVHPDRDVKTPDVDKNNPQYKDPIDTPAGMSAFLMDVLRKVMDIQPEVVTVNDQMRSGKQLTDTTMAERTDPNVVGDMDDTSSAGGGGPPVVGPQTEQSASDAIIQRCIGEHCKKNEPQKHPPVFRNIREMRNLYT